MENTKRLELTLCGMLPYGLNVADNLVQIYKIKGIHQETIYVELDGKTLTGRPIEFRPLLHSLDKLTSPILDGGLIPIEELNSLFGDCETYFHFENGFIHENDKKYTLLELPFFITEKLKEWHFNIYSLPTEMYIEKSLTTN